VAYDNSARTARANETRTRLLTAAHASFLRIGYVATTIRGVADLADVSPETIYKTYGTKAALLKAAYDVTLAGDDRAVPMAERPEFDELRNAADPRVAAAAYGRLAGWLAIRTAPLLRVILASRSGNSDVEAFAATIDAERLTGATFTIRMWQSNGWLQPELTTDRATDILWTLNSPAVFLLLEERGWTSNDYQVWLSTTLLATVLAD
jgi:AcrR family transcriptional regulator